MRRLGYNKINTKEKVLKYIVMNLKSTKDTDGQIVAYLSVFLCSNIRQESGELACEKSLC